MWARFGLFFAFLILIVTDSAQSQFRHSHSFPSRFRIFLHHFLSFTTIFHSSFHLSSCVNAFINSDDHHRHRCRPHYLLPPKPRARAFDLFVTLRRCPNETHIADRLLGVSFTITTHTLAHYPAGLLSVHLCDPIAINEAVTSSYSNERDSRPITKLLECLEHISTYPLRFPTLLPPHRRAPRRC